MQTGSENERRNTNEGMEADHQGVGGRHGYMSSPGWGGGYLDNYTPPGPLLEARKKIALDPRIEELRQMGLNRHWITLAEQLGFDAFMVVWDTLAEMPTRGTQLVLVPKKSLYLRYQRNRLIQALADAGKKSPEIHQELKQITGHKVSRRHIDRIIAAEHN